MSPPSLSPVTPRQFIDSATCMHKLDVTKLCGMAKIDVDGWKFCPRHDAGAVDTMKQNGKIT